jgi:hypothetical protein
MLLSRTFLVAYFVIHLVVSLCIDSQAILSPGFFPTPLKELVQWYTETFKDFLMSNPPTWFQSCIWIELLLQCPYFLYGIISLISRAGKQDNKLFESISIIYGASTVTTLIPILATFVNASGLNTLEKTKLVIIYAPFLVIPLLIMINFAFFAGNRSKEEKYQKSK